MDGELMVMMTIMRMILITLIRGGKRLEVMMTKMVMVMMTIMGMMLITLWDEKSWR